MLPDDARELQRIADYRVASNALRKGANGSQVAGLVNIVLGLMNPSVLGMVIVGLGVVMILTGILARKLPSSAWLLIFGLITISIGLLNMGLTALGLVGGGSSFLWGFLGFVFFLGGVGQILTFARYGRALGNPATPVEVLRLEAMIHHATLADPEKYPDVIGFRVKKGMGEVKWRCVFHGRAILLVERPGLAVLAADRDDAEFTVEGKSNSSGRLRATFSIRSQRWAADIAADALDRFDAWKAGEYDESAEEESGVTPGAKAPPSDAIRTERFPEDDGPPPDAIKAE
jgi:hypothetical protein